jgi:hypothetical protein
MLLAVAVVTFLAGLLFDQIARLSLRRGRKR